MRVVLDCNVLVSVARVDGTCREGIDKVVRVIGFDAVENPSSGDLL